MWQYESLPQEKPLINKEENGHIYSETTLGVCRGRSRLCLELLLRRSETNKKIVRNPGQLSPTGFRSETALFNRESRSG